jgi:phosphotransferase system  glucose/maltose/N-acetylglucosamine-specific IIC component
MPIGAALMLICALITIFVINPEQYGYAGGDHSLAFFEGAGLILASVLIGYIALVFRSV